jgi:hypothetical protein
MGNFYQDTILRSSYFKSEATVRDIMLLEPVTRKAVQNVIHDAMQLDPPVRLVITETYRSTNRQTNLFRQGLTKLDGLTPARAGVHHFGLAADFAKVVNGLATWGGDWSFLRTLAERHGLISGLDWGLPDVRHSFVDPDHVQRATLAEQAALFAGTWYPSGDPVISV